DRLTRPAECHPSRRYADVTEVERLTAADLVPLAHERAGQVRAAFAEADAEPLARDQGVERKPSVATRADRAALTKLDGMHVQRGNARVVDFHLDAGPRLPVRTQHPAGDGPQRRQFDGQRPRLIAAQRQ